MSSSLVILFCPVCLLSVVEYCAKIFIYNLLNDYIFFLAERPKSNEVDAAKAQFAKQGSLVVTIDLPCPTHSNKRQLDGFFMSFRFPSLRRQQLKKGGVLSTGQPNIWLNPGPQSTSLKTS